MDLTESNSRKGQSLQILMFALVIIGIGTGLLTFSRLTAAPVIFEDTMKDAPLISEAQTRTSDTANYYVPTAAHYATSQAVYNDGLDIDTLDSEFDIDNHYQRTRFEIESEADLLLSYYPRELDYRRCQVEIMRKDLAFDAGTAAINITNQNDPTNWTETTCRLDGSVVRTSSDIEKMQKNTSNIRFHQIMTITLNGIDAMYNKSEDIETNNNYKGSETGDSCDDSSSTAKSDAETDGRNDAQNSLDDLVEDIEDAGTNEVDTHDDDTGLLGRVIDFVTPWDMTEFYDDFSEQSRSQDIITQSRSASRSTSCPCDKYNASSPPRHCIQYEYDGDADIDWELHQVTIRSTIRDTEYEIPVDAGWEHLEFKRDFFYNFPAS